MNAPPAQRLRVEELATLEEQEESEIAMREEEDPQEFLNEEMIEE